MQISIALLASIGLVGLELWPSSYRRSNNQSSRIILSSQIRKKHTQAIVAALVDFQKAQCYFAGVVQIAALLLIKQVYAAPRRLYMAGMLDAGLLDTGLLNVIAINGLVPVTFILTCIARYGRQSWYLISLSSLTVVLSTTVLGTEYYFWPSIMTKYYDLYFASLDLASQFCGDAGYEIFWTLCWMSPTSSPGLDYGAFTNYRVWTILANCLTWLLYCIVRKRLTKAPAGSLRARFASAAQPMQPQMRKFIAYLFRSLFILTWSLCFGYQLRLNTSYLSQSSILKTWSFGQIIAVSVWVPSLVEFFYIEYSMSTSFDLNEVTTCSLI